MASNRKFKNGMWKDTSKEQEKVSNDLFLKFQELLQSDFQGMGMQFNQLSGECSYTFESVYYSYTVLVNRKGSIIQEAITRKKQKS